MMNYHYLKYVHVIRPIGLTCVLCLLTFPSIMSANEGIEIRPNADGQFEYQEDFQTPKFLMDGFVNQYRPEIWQPGSIRNQGPSGWSLVYHFFGDRVIENVNILIEQSANGRNLGGAETKSTYQPMDWIGNMRPTVEPSSQDLTCGKMEH